MVFRKYLEEQSTDSNHDIQDDHQDDLLAIPALYNGGAINLEVDSYMSLLCWIQSSNNRKIVCSNLNGENPTVTFTVASKQERVVGFAIDSLDHALFVMVAVRPSNV